MNAVTKVSAKGQVVIPKPVRDRLNWKDGTDLDVIETENGVWLRPREAPRKRITVDEFLERVRPHDGPPVSLEEMDQAILDEAAARFIRKTGR